MKKRAFSVVALLTGLVLAFALIGCGDVEDEQVIDPVYQGRTSGTLRSEDATGGNKEVTIGPRSISYQATAGVQYTIEGLHTSPGGTKKETVKFNITYASVSYSWAYLYKGTEKIGVVFHRIVGAGVSIQGLNPEAEVLTYYLGKDRCDQLAVNQIRAVFDSACDTSDMSPDYHGLGAKTIAKVN
jgi:uncharacterized lipoprotein YehR (DUF1307 family)